MKNYIRKNKDLLRNAKLIFGENVVEQAYFVQNYYEEYTEVEKSRIFKNLANPSIDYTSSDTNSISYDAVEILIKFKNGNCVSFRNSEWASMTKVNFTTYEIK